MKIKVDRPGPQNPPPEIMFSATCLRSNLKMQYWMCPKTMVFITYSPHCFVKKYASNKNKKQRNKMTTDRFTKPHKTENIDIPLDH